MSDGDFAIQVTIKGLDSGGREVEFVIRGVGVSDFNINYTALKTKIDSLKPIPQKTWAGKQGTPKKPIVYLDDAPKCAKHNTPLDIYEWSSPEGTVAYYWTCRTFDSETKSYCKEKAKSRPTPEQVAKWKKLNGKETHPTSP